MRRVTRNADAAVFIVLYDFNLILFDIRPEKKDSFMRAPDGYQDRGRTKGNKDLGPKCGYLAS